MNDSLNIINETRERAWTDTSTNTCTTRRMQSICGASATRRGTAGYWRGRLMTYIRNKIGIEFTSEGSLRSPQLIHWFGSSSFNHHFIARRTIAICLRIWTLFKSVFMLILWIRVCFQSMQTSSIFVWKTTLTCSCNYIAQWTLMTRVKPLPVVVMWDCTQHTQSRIHLAGSPLLLYGICIQCVSSVWVCWYINIIILCTYNWQTRKFSCVGMSTYALAA